MQAFITDQIIKLSWYLLFCCVFATWSEPVLFWVKTKCLLGAVVERLAVVLITLMPSADMRLALRTGLTGILDCRPCHCCLPAYGCQSLDWIMSHSPLFWIACFWWDFHADFLKAHFFGCCKRHVILLWQALERWRHVLNLCLWLPYL